MKKLYVARIEFDICLLADSHMEAELETPGYAACELSNDIGDFIAVREVTDAADIPRELKDTVPCQCSNDDPKLRKTCVEILEEINKQRGRSS